MGGNVANGVVELGSTVVKGRDTNGVRVIPGVDVCVMVGDISGAKVGGVIVARGVGLGDGVAVMGTPHKDELVGPIHPLIKLPMRKTTIDREKLPESMKKL